MPEPKEGETQKEYIPRCIKYLMDKGETDDNKQAAAICYSYWEKKGTKESVEKIVNKHFLNEDDKTEMKCQECGKEFKKKIGKGTYEVKCPKCGSYDTEPK